MAGISREQLLKELLPGLTALFGREYESRLKCRVLKSGRVQTYDPYAGDQPYAKGTKPKWEDVHWGDPQL